MRLIPKAIQTNRYYIGVLCVIMWISNNIQQPLCLLFEHYVHCTAIYWV